jgi:mRNA interferase MazF
VPDDSDEIRRGNLYWVDWSPGRGSEQTGHRPALVVATDQANRNPRYPLTIVVAVTTQIRDILTHVAIQPDEENGLRQPSAAKCEQILTVSKDRLTERIGSISADDLERIDTALRRSLSLR